MELFPPVKPTILVVDDSPANLTLITGLLHPLYTVKVASHGQRALDVCRAEPPDLLLLDIMMPGMDGYEVCRRLKSEALTCQIPVIFLTSRAEVQDEQRGMDLGAVDYITRPISPPILMSRVRAHFVDALHSKTLRVNNEYLEFEVTRRAHQLMALQNVTMLALASLAETRDSETGNHLKRTQSYVRVLAHSLAHNPQFANELNGERIDIMCKCAPLHDIGKVGIPDKILLKPGRYSTDEFAIMKTHPTLGRNAIASAQSLSSQRLEFLEVAKDIVYCHHEKWDGSGYPQGLAGERIPLSARLMAVADVYDALISRRVYKEGITHECACNIIEQGRASHFDPAVVDAFLRVADEFWVIACEFLDTDSDLQKKAHFHATSV